MKKILFIFIIYFASIVYSSAEQKCNELPGFKKLGKDSIEYVKCLKDKDTLDFTTNETTNETTIV